MRESVVYQEILAEGKRKEACKIAMNLLQIGMTVEQVAQVTELSVEQVRILHSRKNVSDQE